MGFDQILSTFRVSGTGMKAERQRMEVISNNIANANSTRTAEGGAYRRKEVVFAAVLKQEEASGAGAKRAHHLAGVKSLGIVDDLSEQPRVHNPGHPDADPDGFVTMPNVNLPLEMVNLVTATRAYEANLKVANAFQNMAEQSFQLLK